ncbi:MAG TPA: GGDEF domain-containing protein [Terriglobus sp.]
MDRRTLFTVQAGLLLFLGGVILASMYFQVKKRRDKGAVWFSVAYISAGIGLALQAQRGVISNIFSILFGNGLFMLFGPFVNRAIARTTGQKRDYFVLLLLLDAATVMNYAYYTWWQPNVLLRTIEAVPVMIVMYLACIDLLLRNRDRVIRPAIYAMLACFCAHAMPSIIRVTLAIRFRVSDGWFSWFGIVVIAGLAMSYMWISNLRMHAELEHSAMTDPLTGLFNRRGLDVLATRELERLRRNDLPCSALMMDVNRFKQINDRLGHAAGDASLCAVAETLTTTLRVTDLPIRLGGDEFFVLLPDCGESQAGEIVTRLRTAISQLRLKTVAGVFFDVSVSIGAVTLPGHNATLEELLHGSDIVLYREKQALRANDSVDMDEPPLHLPSPRGAHPSNA